MLGKTKRCLLLCVLSKWAFGENIFGRGWKVHQGQRPSLSASSPKDRKKSKRQQQKDRKKPTWARQFGKFYIVDLGRTSSPVKPTETGPKQVQASTWSTSPLDGAAPYQQSMIAPSADPHCVDVHKMTPHMVLVMHLRDMLRGIVGFLFHILKALTAHDPLPKYESPTATSCYWPPSLLLDLLE